MAVMCMMQCHAHYIEVYII